MRKRIILYICFILFASSSCTTKHWTIIHSTSTKIAIDSTLESIADKNYEAYLQPIKAEIDKKMNVVIGEASQTMEAHAPESLLSNFSSDVYKTVASDYLKEKVDIAIVNMGGLRSSVSAGNITVRKIYELMPFENELVILWLKGDKLEDLLQYFASVGGEGVSGLRMTIENNKAVNISIGNQPLDSNKIYTIATNDYLAGGNDKMYQLALYSKRINTGLKIRSLLIDYIKSETNKGHKIQSQLDGRISIN